MYTCLYCSGWSDGVALADFAYCFSPLVEETAHDLVVADVEGCELRFGSAYGLANEINSLALRPMALGGLGRSINVSLAANPDIAILAARFFKGLTFIAPGEELAALGELPIENLLNSKTHPGPTSKIQRPKSGIPNSILNTPSSSLNKDTLDVGPWTLDFGRAQEILETFRLWGVRTFLDLAKLPTTGVAERLGQEGVKLQQLAAGKVERHLKLKQPAPVFQNAIELDYPLTELEPLSFIFARLLNQLCARLIAYALATNELRICLTLEGGIQHERTLNLPTPLRDHKTFLKLLLLDIEAHPPAQAVIGVAIGCEPVKPRVLQNGLFIPQAPEPAKLELTLARLTKLVGTINVGSPEIVDTHRPDTFQMKRFLLKTDQLRGRRDAGIRGRGEGVRKEIFTGPRVSPSPHHRVAVSPSVAFRRFRPPLRAMVDATRGYPERISAWGKNRSVYGKVVRLAGPWRRTGDWWRNDCWARDEWDVAVEGQAVTQASSPSAPPKTSVLYRLYRELRGGAWFVEGEYD